ncbi:MAG TPA: DUF4190 domain-containing protein [Streptosporangiaceae bacterium]|jgi:hypothetical protein
MPTPDDQSADAVAVAGTGATPTTAPHGDEPQVVEDSEGGEPQPNGAEPNALRSSGTQPSELELSVLEVGGGSEPQPNGFATAALVCGILGVTGLGIVLALSFGVAGLVRARRRRSGKVRCWAGIAAALLWAVPWVFLGVHAIKAADPGCTTYKGPALIRYNRAIEAFDSRQNSARVVADFKIAITALRSAADQSQGPAAHSALGTLTRQLGKALADEESGQVPPALVMRTLNHDVAQADAACGTL